jgi:WD40 repeat protein
VAFHGPLPQIPDFEVLKHIGGGAYGEVFLARSVTDGYRAIKVVWRSRFKDSSPYEREFEGVRRFAELSLRERRQMALLHVGRDDAGGFFYSVMELADDIESGIEIHPESYVPATLEEIRQRRGRLSSDEVLSIAVDLATALANLHGAGLVHRDIKPANVILVRGVPKIADVGLVCVARDEASLVGTPDYMAPEKPGRAAADVYSFGRTLYVLAFGRDPTLCPLLPGDVDQYPDYRRLMELNEVITRACEGIPEKRYVDGAAILEELRLLAAGGSIARIRSMERGLAVARKVGMGLIAVAVVAALIGAWQALDAIRERKARARIEIAERQASEALMISRLGLAQAEIAEERFGRARDHLRQVWPGTPSSAPFEWRVLWREARGMTAHELDPAGAGVERLCFSPDGTRLAGRTSTNGLVVWDLATGRATARVADVQILAGFSPRYDAWATRARDTVLRFWSSSGERIAEAKHPSATYHTTLSDGRILIAQMSDRADTLRLLDPSGSGSTLSNTLAEGTNRAEIWFAAVTPDGSRFIVERSSPLGGASAGLLEAGHFGTNGPDSVLQLPGVSWAIACAPDGKSVAYGIGSAGDFVIASLSNLGLQTRVPTDHVGEVQAIGFSPDSRWVATGGDEGNVRVWDTSSTNLASAAARLSGHSGRVSSVAWDPAGHRLASGDQLGEVRVWSFPARPLPLRNVLDGFDGAGGRAIPSGDDTLLAYSDASGRVRIERLDGGGSLGHLTHGAFAPLAFIAQDRELVASTQDSRFGVWDLGSLQLRRIFAYVSASNGPPVTAAVSHDGRWLGVLAASGRLGLTDTQSGEIRWVDAVGETHSIAAGETLGSLITVSDGGHIESWDPGTGSRRWHVELKLRGRVNEVAASLNGTHVHIGDEDGWLYSIAVRDLKVARQVQPKGSLLNALAVSPDGERVVVGYSSEFISLLAGRSLEERMTLGIGSGLGPPGYRVVSRATFSRSGRVLVVRTRRGGIRIWSTD